MDTTKVSDLPVFTTRLHPEHRDRLRAVSQVTGRPIWKLVEEAVLNLSDSLPAKDRRLVDALVERRS